MKWEDARPDDILVYNRDGRKVGIIEDVGTDGLIRVNNGKETTLVHEDDMIQLVAGDLSKPKALDKVLEVLPELNLKAENSRLHGLKNIKVYDGPDISPVKLFGAPDIDSNKLLKSISDGLTDQATSLFRSVISKMSDKERLRLSNFFVDKEKIDIFVKMVGESVVTVKADLPSIKSKPQQSEVSSMNFFTQAEEAAKDYEKSLAKDLEYQRLFPDKITIIQDERIIRDIVHYRQWKESINK